MSKSTLKITFLAMLVAVNVTLNAVTITVSGIFAGISFSYIPCFLAGMFMGPVAGAAVGFLGDVIGCIIAPKGPWIPLITLGSTLLGLIPGLIFKIKKMHPTLKLVISAILVYIFTSSVCNTLGLYPIMGKGATLLVFAIGRLPAQAAMVAANMVIIASVSSPLKRLVFDKLNTKVYYPT